MCEGERERVRERRGMRDRQTETDALKQREKRRDIEG